MSAPSNSPVFTDEKSQAEFQSVSLFHKDKSTVLNQIQHAQKTTQEFTNLHLKHTIDNLSTDSILRTILPDDEKTNPSYISYDAIVFSSADSSQTADTTDQILFTNELRTSHGKGTMLISNKRLLLLSSLPQIAESFERKGTRVNNKPQSGPEEGYFVKSQQREDFHFIGIPLSVIRQGIAIDVQNEVVSEAGVHYPHSCCNPCCRIFCSCCCCPKKWYFDAPRLLEIKLNRSIRFACYLPPWGKKCNLTIYVSNGESLTNMLNFTRTVEAVTSKNIIDAHPLSESGAGSGVSVPLVISSSPISSKDRRASYTTITGNNSNPLINSTLSIPMAISSPITVYEGDGDHSSAIAAPPAQYGTMGAADIKF